MMPYQKRTYLAQCIIYRLQSQQTFVLLFIHSYTNHLKSADLTSWCAASTQSGPKTEFHFQLFKE